MPDLKISQLPVASATTGAELFPVVQGGVTKQIALNAVRHIGSAVFDANGSMAVDTNTLFVDAVNNRVGVNCTPVVPAQIRTQTNGNVGFQPATVLTGGNKINNFNDAAAVAVGLELDASAHVLLISGTEALRVDAARNAGLGVTPSAWDIGRVAQIGVATGAFVFGDGLQAIVGTNAYYGTSSWRYGGTGQASYYEQNSGQHRWFTAPSGTAGNAISFTQRLQVDGTTTAGQTALMLWDVDNGTLERVTVGAADSGGTGFKVLRIPN